MRKLFIYFLFFHIALFAQDLTTKQQNNVKKAEYQLQLFERTKSSDYALKSAKKYIDKLVNEAPSNSIVKNLVTRYEKDIKVFNAEKIVRKIKSTIASTNRILEAKKMYSWHEKNLSDYLVLLENATEELEAIDLDEYNDNLTEIAEVSANIRIKLKLPPRETKKNDTVDVATQEMSTQEQQDTESTKSNETRTEKKEQQTSTAKHPTQTQPATKETPKQEESSTKENEKTSTREDDTQAATTENIKRKIDSPEKEIVETDSTKQEAIQPKETTNTEIPVETNPVETTQPEETNKTEKTSEAKADPIEMMQPKETSKTEKEFAELPSNVKSRLNKVSTYLQNTQKIVDKKDIKNAIRSMATAQREWENIFKFYGTKFEPQHPEVLEVKALLETTNNNIVALEKEATTKENNKIPAEAQKFLVVARNNLQNFFNQINKKDLKNAEQSLINAQNALNTVIKKYNVAPDHPDLAPGINIFRQALGMYQTQKPIIEKEMQQKQLVKQEEANEQNEEKKYKKVIEALESANRCADSLKNSGSESDYKSAIKYYNEAIDGLKTFPQNEKVANMLNTAAQGKVDCIKMITNSYYTQALNAAQKGYFSTFNDYLDKLNNVPTDGDNNIEIKNNSLQALITASAQLYLKEVTKEDADIYKFQRQWAKTRESLKTHNALDKIAQEAQQQSVIFFMDKAMNALNDESHGILQAKLDEGAIFRNQAITLANNDKKILEVIADYDGEFEKIRTMISQKVKDQKEAEARMLQERILKFEQELSDDQRNIFTKRSYPHRRDFKNNAWIWTYIGKTTIDTYNFDSNGKLTSVNNKDYDAYIPIFYNNRLVGYVAPSTSLSEYGAIYDTKKEQVGSYRSDGIFYGNKRIADALDVSLGGNVSYIGRKNDKGDLLRMADHYYLAGKPKNFKIRFYPLWIHKNYNNYTDYEFTTNVNPEDYAEMIALSKSASEKRDRKDRVLNNPERVTAFGIGSDLETAVKCAATALIVVPKD